MGRRSRNRQPPAAVTPDPRLTAEPVRAIGGAAVSEDTWAVVVAPVNLRDGRTFAFHNPQAVALNLVEAKAQADRGVKRRKAILAKLEKRQDGMWQAPDSRKVTDCLMDLSAAVLCSYAAIEGPGNHTIAQLHDDAVVEVGRDGGVVAVPRDEMVRRLSVSEKLDKVIPLFTGTESIKGGVLWEKFVALRRLRDELVHIKNRAYSSDPAEPAVYGQLVRGDADSCAEDAIAIVLGVRPEFLPAHVLAALRLETGSPTQG